MRGSRGVSRTIRQFLKTETSDLHEALDRRMSPLTGGDPADYSCFLRIQFRARRPLERWIAAAGGESPAPPSQLELIADDLRRMGCTLPHGATEWSAPGHGNALGLFWVLAGSSFGNRMIRKQLETAAPCLPVSFLSDRTMAGYWTALVPQLEASANGEDARPASRMAAATFEHFLAVADTELAREAA